MARLIIKVKEQKNGNMGVDMLTKDMTKGTEAEKRVILQFVTILNSIIEKSKQINALNP